MIKDSQKRQAEAFLPFSIRVDRRKNHRRSGGCIEVSNQYRRQGLGAERFTARETRRSPCKHGVTHL